MVLYQVKWDGKDAARPHHVVNALLPQTGPTEVFSRTTYRVYNRPTLRGAGDAAAPTSYKSPSRQLEWVLVSESAANGYSATVKAVPYHPTNLVGAVAAPAGPPAVPKDKSTADPPVGRLAGDTTAALDPDLPLPDIDLHAYDEQGRHVGLDYASGQYVNEIPGAIASGDLKDDEEWIYVPAGTAVRFETSAYKTEQFLQSAPEYREVIRSQQFETTYQRIDASGVITAAKGQGGEIAAGAEAELEGPEAPGLNYKPVKAPGYGRNLPENLWWSGLLAALGLMAAAGWVVSLARR